MDIFIEHPRPIKDKTLAIVILILNIVPLPGVGTLIYNLQTKDDKWVNAIVPMVFSLSIFGGFLAILGILGLIWAIVDGVKIYQASEAYRADGGEGTTAKWTTTTTIATPDSEATDYTSDTDGSPAKWQRVRQESDRK